MNSKEFSEKICKVLLDRKAQDVLSIDVKEKTAVADYYVIAGGRSMTQTRALIDHVEEEMEKLKKQVVDGLEDACKKKGGSALASTIVKNSLKRKLNDDEWREMLKIFLKAKSIGVEFSSNLITFPLGV